VDIIDGYKRLFCGAGGDALNNSINLKLYPVLSCVTLHG
jgi:hypothetical protein